MYGRKIPASYYRYGPKILASNKKDAQRLLTQGNGGALVEYQVGNPKVTGSHKSFSDRPPENYGGEENSSENSGLHDRIFF
jgi:hypothetical protein